MALGYHIQAAAGWYNQPMPFQLFLAAKYLKPTRSWMSAITVFSVLGVVLGVAIIIVVRAVMTGFGDMWREKILAFKPHITISSASGIIRDEAAVVEAVTNVPGVSAASPSVEARVLAEHGRRVSAPAVIGVSADDLPSLHPQIASGIVQGSLDLDEDSVLIGVDLAWQLGLSVGDTMLIYSPMNLVAKDEKFFPEEARVGGIFRMGQRDFDSGFIISSIGFARDLMGLTRGAYSVHVKTDAPLDTAAFRRTEEGVAELLGPSYIVRTWQEVDSDLFNALAVEKNMMMVLNLFTTIVAMFCVTVTLIVATVQKRSQIGLLRALGFSRSKVMGVFMVYGWILCMVGTALGVGLAYAVLFNLQNLVDLMAGFGVDVFPKSVYGLEQIPWRVLPSEVVAVAVAVVVFSTLSGLVPAWVAARKDPVETLRG